MANKVDFNLPRNMFRLLFIVTIAGTMGRIYEILVVPG